MNYGGPKAGARRKRYRLNKKKLGVALLVLGCTGALVVVAVIALSHAGDITVASMGIPGRRGVG